MNHIQKLSVNPIMKGAGVFAIASAILLNFALIFTLTSAAPEAAVCIVPTFPMEVSNEADLNNAIDCFNQEAAVGSHVISFTQTITLSSSTTAISNTRSGVELEVNGIGFTLDGENTPGVRPLAIYTDTVVVLNDLAVTGGNITTTVRVPLNAGGGIQNFGHLTLNETDVISNAVASFGGGIYNYENATLEIVDSAIDDNATTVSASMGDGGGIQNLGTLTITRSSVSGNTSARFSAGIGTFLGPVTIHESRIANNEAGNTGGGLFNRGAIVNIYDSVFDGNKTTVDGGGIYIDNNAELNVYRTTISGNESDRSSVDLTQGGGGVNLRASTSGEWENVTISGNDSASGGAVVNSGTFTFTHMTIVSNTGDLNLHNSGNLALINSILAGNGTSDCSNTGTLTVNSDNLIQTDDVTNACSGAALSVDPQLEPLAANGGYGDTHLPKIGSPVIDAATSLCLATDQREVPRVGGMCEIGAVEIADATVSIADASITEGTGGTSILTFTLTRSDASLAMSVTVNTTDDSATAGSDYTAITSQVVGFDGMSLTKDVGVTITTDSLVEANETFTVTLSNPINLTIGDGEAVGTINDDDMAMLTLSSGVASVTEGDSGTTDYVFTATLSAAVDGGFDVNVMSADGTATTADSDYVGVDEELTFNGTANESQTVTVTVNGDTLGESNETFTVSLGTITSTIPALSAKINPTASPQTGTILDDDTPSFTITAAMTSVVEADTAIPVTITLSSASGVTTSVQVQSSDGSATAGADYSAVTETVEFAPGETSKTISVTVLADTDDESDETIDLSLSSPDNANLGSPSTIMLTIVDNDGTPGINIENTTYSVSEAGGSVDVVLTLSNGSGFPVSVTLKSADVTALAGSDYTAVDQVVVFAAGEISKTVPVSVTNDTLYEGDETLTLTISDPVNGMLSVNTTAVVTIEEDDALPMVTIQDVTQVEGDLTNELTFTISLDKAAGVTVTVGYMTQDGTATVADSDYVAKSGTVNIPAGDTSGSVVITVTGDDVVESDETFILILSTVTNGMLDSMLPGRTGTATLTNDDSDPVTMHTIFLPIVVR